MIDTLMPFLMLGILVAAVLTRPLERLNWLSISSVLVLVGFVSSEIWVGLGKDTGLRWEILRDLVFYLLLPILIFEAAISVNVKALRREAVLIFSMAIPLLLVAAGISACIFQLLMSETIGGNWALALLMGSMICATDPTTLSGVLGGRNPGDTARTNRAGNILEGESLINDGTTITLFVILAGVLTMTGDEISFSFVLLTFLITLFGGSAVGAALGWLFDKLIGPLNDHVLTTSATLVLAFASFWIAEHLLGLSGVVATLTAGLTIAWRQRVHRKEMDIAFALGRCSRRNCHSAGIVTESGYSTLVHHPEYGLWCCSI